jgi:hypothetical protein
MRRSRTIKQAGHVARMGKMENKYIFSLRSLRRRYHLKCVGGRIILKLMLRKQGGICDY